METMTIGATDVFGFAGLGVPYLEDTNNDGKIDEFDTPNDEAIGFSITDLDFAMSIMKPTALAGFGGGPTFTSLKATADQIAFVGGGGIFNLEASNLELSLNTSSLTLPSTPTINFASSFPAESDDEDGDGLENEPTGFQVRTGGDPIYLDFDSPLIQFSVDQAIMSIADFIHLRGSFAFTKGPAYTVQVNTGISLGGEGESLPPLEMETLTIGASNIQAFVGLNGPYRDDTNGDGVVDENDSVNEDAIGAFLDNIDFGIAMMTPTAIPPALSSIGSQIKFLSLKFSAQAAGFIGTDPVLEAILKDVEVEFNDFLPPGGGKAALAAVLLPTPHIDFVASFPGEDSNGNGVLDDGEDSDEDGVLDGPGLEIDTGGDPVVLDFSTELIRMKIGYFEANVADGIVQFSGSAEIALGPTQEVVLTDGSTETVRTLTLGMNDVNGFAGFGPYFEDTNGNGRIDENDTTRDSAIGLVLEDLDLGLVIMQNQDLFNPGFYLAAKMSITRIGLVGIPGVTMEATDMELKINLGASLESGLAVVDWAASFPAGDRDGDGEAEPLGFEVPTGNEDEPVIIDYDGLLIAVSGAAEIDIFGVVKLSGVFDFELSDSGLVAFASGQLSISAGDTDLLSVDALALLSITNAGLAMRLDINVDISLASVLEFDSESQLLVNTTGQAIDYTVPERLQDTAGFTNVTIPAGPPQFDGSEGDPGSYITLRMEGNLTIASLIELQGKFFLEISETELELQIQATADFFIGQMAAGGLLRINEEGVVGSLQLAVSTGQNIGAGGIFSIEGQFQLEINSTDSAQTIQTLNIADDGSVSEFIPGTIEANTYRILVGGSVTVFDILKFEGRMEMQFSPEGFEAEMDMRLDITIAEIAVSGAVAILNTDEGPVFAMRIDVDFGFDIGGVITVDFGIEDPSNGGTIEINTGDQEYAGVDANTFRIAAGGTIDILALSGTLQAEMSIVDGLFELRLNEASISFFGVLDIGISGFIRSNGEFRITGEVDFNIDLGILEFYTNFELTVANDGFELFVRGGVDLVLDFGLFEKSFTIAGVEGFIQLYPKSASLSITVTVIGISVSGSISWGIDVDPILATQVDGTLYLNIGDRAAERGKEFKDIRAESLQINALDESGKNVKVSGLGHEMDFYGVDRIVGNGGEATDSIVVSQGVKSILDLDMGEGDDSVFILSAGAGSIIRMGDGDDDVYSRAGTPIPSNTPGELTDPEGPFTFHLGSGTDFFNGADGHEEVFAETGTNQVNTQGGNDTVTISGTSFAETGGGNDTVTINGNEFTSVEVSLGDGDDTAIVNGGNNTARGGAGNDTFTLALEEGETTLIGGPGDDRATKTLSSGSDFTLEDYQFRHDVFVVNLDDSLEMLEVTDTDPAGVAVTSPSPSSSYTWGEAGLTIDASGTINVSDLYFRAPEGQLALYSVGISGTLKMETRVLTVVNFGSGANADITVEEVDDLIVTRNYVANGGLYTSNGAIDVRLEARDAVLTHRSGVITTGNGGGSITLRADDMDLRAGADSVSGRGSLQVLANSGKQTYRIGGAGQSPSGNDFTAGDPDGSLDFSMRDYASLKDGFDEIRIGHDSGETLMLVGDLKERNYPNYIELETDDDGALISDFYGNRQGQIVDTTFDASGKDPISLVATRVNVVGNIQSSESVNVEARLAEINSQNINDPLGPPDSGIDAQTIRFMVDEQMVVSGWLRADDRIEGTVSGTTGEGSLLNFSEGPNSFTADVGSTIITRNDHSAIDITTSASVRIGTSIELGGVDSTATIDAGTGLVVLSGAVLAGRNDGAALNLNSGDYLHIESGGAVTAGAGFVTNEDGVI